MRLFNFFKDTARRALDPLLTRIALSAGYRVERNILLAMQRNAVSETAAYVRDRMDKVPALRSAHDLLRWAAKHCYNQEGLVLEFGVWKGDSLKVIGNIFDQTVYGFDSFQGLPEDWRTGIAAGSFALDRPPRVPSNVELIIGWFSETLDEFLATHPAQIKFLHIDCDLYSSTLDVLNRCVERLTAGSIIVFDEYFNYPNWQEGEFRAFQEVIAAHQINYRYIGYVGSNEQVAVEVISTGPSISPDLP